MSYLSAKPPGMPEHILLRHRDVPGIHNLQVYREHGGYRALQSEARMRETLAEHQALVDALAAGDPDAAVLASQTHIQGARRRLLG